MRKVLVVDDDASLRDLFAEELRCRGYAVSIARNGRQALERLDTETPDAIVLDLMMPVMDGWTFIEHYRDRPARAPVPIIVVSATGDLASGHAAGGVTAFLRKPLNLDELADCVARLTR